MASLLPKSCMLDCDMLLVPAIPTPAPMAEIFGRSMTADEFDGLTRFTAVFDMTGSRRCR